MPQDISTGIQQLTKQFQYSEPLWHKDELEAIQICFPGCNGHYDIFPRMLKETALTITPAVTRLFIRLGEVPKCGKLLVLRLFPSHVITPENYCPISLLSVPSKPLELHIRNLVIAHLEKYCPLSAHLWGIYSKQVHNCYHARCNWPWHRRLDLGLVICCVFFDYSKAFDSVPYRPLLQRLKTSMSIHISSDKSCTTSVTEDSDCVWMVHLQMYYLCTLVTKILNFSVYGLTITFWSLTVENANIWSSPEESNPLYLLHLSRLNKHIWRGSTLESGSSPSSIGLCKSVKYAKNKDRQQVGILYFFKQTVLATSHTHTLNVSPNM